MEMICTPRPVRGTRDAKSAGLTTRMSAVTASMTISAVLPMKKRLSAERETTPMATIEQRSRFVVRGMTSFGRPFDQVTVTALDVEAIDGARQVALREFHDISARGHVVDQRSIRHGRHHRQGGQQRVQGMQFAVQRVNQLRTGTENLPVQFGWLGVRMSRIDGRQHARSMVEPAVLDQQHRHGTKPQQLPVGVGQQPACRVTSGTVMILDHQQIGADALHLADDGFVGREVPVGGHVDVDAMFAHARCDFLQLFAPRRLDLALPGFHIDVTHPQRLGI